MPEPVTTVGIGAVAAYLSKDGLNKILGPTAEYLGGGLRDFTAKRIDNIGRIFKNAEEKIGSKIDKPGQVPPKVLKTIIDEASYNEDLASVEYFGGILASSRTEQSRDDRGARVAKILEQLSTYQIHTHYIAYKTIRHLFKDSGYLFNMEDRPKMEIFIPFSTYFSSMKFDEKEQEQLASILNNTFFGLSKENLIGNFQYGPEDHMKKKCSKVTCGGISIEPTAFGCELFLWGHGQGTQELGYILKGETFKDIEEIPIDYSGVIATNNKNN